MESSRLKVGCWVVSKCRTHSYIQSSKITYSQTLCIESWVPAILSVKHCLKFFLCIFSSLTCLKKPVYSKQVLLRWKVPASLSLFLQSEKKINPSSAFWPVPSANQPASGTDLKSSWKGMYSSPSPTHILLQHPPAHHEIIFFFIMQISMWFMWLGVWVVVLSPSFVSHHQFL